MNVKELDSTKIYWLDKEETVKVKLVGLDMTHGFGSAKYTFRVLFGGAGDIVYMDSNLPKTIHEAVDGESWQFTTPIAMKCTEDQFNLIKDKLVEMGYKFYGITFGEKYRYLSSNFAKDKRCITDLAIGSKYFKECSPIIFQSLNPDMFLALAAMTDKEDGIKGEWWKAKAGVGFHVQQGGEVCGLTRAFFRKATAQEIIEHFEKKEFVLPERWCVKVGDLNTNEIILKWRRENTKYKYYSGSIGYINCDGFFTEEPLCTEITYDKFKKYVLKETEQSCQIIPIPPTKQATIFDDRVEITDWEPKEGEIVWVVTNEIGSLIYKDVEYNGSLLHAFLFRNGFIKRTEYEAKRLVEKLKQAML